MLGSDIQKLQQEHPDYIDKVRANYWWNFIALVLDSSIYSFSVATLSQDTIIPYFVSQLSDQKWIIGVVPAIFYLGFFLPQLLGAYIVNGKPTRKRTIFKIAVAERAGILLIAIVAQMYGLLNAQVTLVLFLLAYMIFSVTNGMIIPGYSDFISKNIIRNRGLFFGFKNGASGLIGFGASLLVRNLLNGYPFPENIRYAFWVGLAASVISPIIITTFKEIPYPVERVTEPLKDFIIEIPQHVRNTPKFVKFIIPRAVFGLSIIGNAFYALYAMSRFSLTAGSLAIFTMIILFTQSMIGFIWGWLGDRLGYKFVYFISSLLMVVVGVFALLATSPWMFYLIAFCIGGQYAAYMICDSIMVFEIAPSSETSRFIGISNTLLSPVMALSPLLGGFLVDIFSYSFLFSTVILISLVSAFLSISMMPNTKSVQTNI
jgi:MFS family permease